MKRTFKRGLKETTKQAVIKIWKRGKVIKMSKLYAKRKKWIHIKCQSGTLNELQFQYSFCIMSQRVNNDSELNKNYYNFIIIKAKWNQI